MAYPEHPKTIIIKNKFYPKGLREVDVWEYYRYKKSRILDQTRNRDLMLGVMTDINKPVLLRKGQTTKFIKLNNSNYDNIMHGRITTIYSTMKRSEDIAIIDIDCDNFRRGQVAALEAYEFVMDKVPIISGAQIRYTGKTGFHIFCDLVRKIDVDSSRLLFRKFLLESDLSKKYTVEHKRRRGIPNLDLSPNKFKGAFITLHSLSILGLKCMKIDHGDLLSFNPHKAKILLSKIR